MTTTSQGLWLLLEDDAGARLVLKQAIEDAGYECRAVARFNQAREILRTEPIDICVFDFFFDNENATSDVLISELRDMMPSMPIILMSAACKPKDIEKCIWAGADLFVPKIPAGLHLINLLQSSAFMAKLNRQRRLEGIQPASRDSSWLFLTPRTQRQLAMVQKQIYGDVLITGEASTGKSTFASNLARELVARHPDRFSAHQILTFNLDDADDLTSLTTKLQLLSSRNIQPDRMSLICIDNIEALRPSDAQRLLSLWEAVKSQSLKIIACCDSSNVPAGMHRVADHEISLPSIEDLRSEIEIVLKDLLNRECEIRKYPNAVMDVGARDKIVSFLQKTSLRGNFLALQRILSDALLLAMEENRRTIFTTDIQLPAQNSVVHTPSLRSQLKIELDDEGEQSLAALIKYVVSGENYKKARQLLNDAMISCARNRFGDNPSLIANSLGVTRQTLYNIGYEARRRAKEGDNHAN